MRRQIEKLLAGLAVIVFPTLLVALAVGVLLLRLLQVDDNTATELPLRVWMQDAAEPATDHTTVLRLLRASEPSTAFKTNLSTRDVWFALDVGSAFDGSTQVVDFPSRHAITLTCWDADTDALMGEANRSKTEGQLAESRSGFALTATQTHPLRQVLCKAAFRGPAKLSAQVWTADALRNAQISHRNTGAMIDAGIGMLALFMLLSAWVNRSRLYWIFVGWLLLNMRMAALSAGTDWELFGFEIDPSMVIGMRQWTVCLYFSMTGALFSQFFKKELDELHAGWLLTALQTLAVVFAALPLVLTFEQTLLAIWPCTVAGTAIIVWYLVKILRSPPSRVAGWYAASIAISALSSLTEVVAAATGPLVLLAGMNHVTAAIASAMLASLAMAEHMRTDRLEKIEAQETLRAAYQDSPIGLFTVGEGGLLIKTNPTIPSQINSV